MSTITNDDVRHLAQLSSLQMSGPEVKSIRADIEGIINYIGQLDVSGDGSAKRLARRRNY